MSLTYSGFFDAARMREGLVVASCGLYFSMAGSSVSACARQREGSMLTGKVTGVADDNLSERAAQHLISSRSRWKQHTVPVALSWSSDEDMIACVV